MKQGEVGTTDSNRRYNAFSLCASG
jgi:hypothetical protein